MAIISVRYLRVAAYFGLQRSRLLYYVSPPPLYGAQENAQQGAVNALSQSFMHWGFLAWAIVGSLTSIVVGLCTFTTTKACHLNRVFALPSIRRTCTERSHRRFDWCMLYCRCSGSGHHRSYRLLGLASELCTECTVWYPWWLHDAADHHLIRYRSIHIIGIERLP